jgi:thiamine pyrophosphokinase
VNSFTRLSAVKKNIKIYKENGGLVSLLPLSRKIKGISTTGLKYKLENDSLFRDKTRGISNIMTSKEAEIKFEEGVLLVIQVLPFIKS